MVRDVRLDERSRVARPLGEALPAPGLGCLTRRRFLRLGAASVAGAFLAGALPARPALAFDTHWHAEATRHAMEANGFSADARLVAQVENYLTDFLTITSPDSVGGFRGAYNLLGGRPKGAPADLRGIKRKLMDRLHFDSLFSAEDLEHQWATLEDNTLAALAKFAASPAVSPAWFEIVLLTVVGASLHAVQDFYSHSNWVDLYVAAGEVVPVWHAVPAAERRQLRLTTGSYPKRLPGKPHHDDLNHDNSSRPRHAEAADAANRGSVDWVARLLENADIPWGRVQSYRVPDQAYRHFLYTLDASWVTSTSILARHWDGPNPQSHVFDTDPARELAKAAIVASGVLLGPPVGSGLGYIGALALKRNKYKLPSPYWAGFYVHHVERDLAEGLLPKAH